MENDKEMAGKEQGGFGKKWPKNSPKQIKRKNCCKKTRKKRRKMKSNVVS